MRWPEFSLKGMRGLIVFGGQVAAARVLWFLYSQADIFIAGKLLGKELLGFYSIAMHLVSLPAQRTLACPAQRALCASVILSADIAGSVCKRSCSSVLSS